MNRSASGGITSDVDMEGPSMTILSLSGSNEATRKPKLGFLSRRVYYFITGLAPGALARLKNQNFRFAGKIASVFAAQKVFELLHVDAATVDAIDDAC